jgi:hypothetical protein
MLTLAASVGAQQYPGCLHGQWRRGRDTVREIRLMVGSLISTAAVWCRTELGELIAATTWPLVG